ncbi:RHS repeat-associated core domain-containing protein, partial [Pseudomonas sp. ok602]|uniref:RHS repeat-associated core domain-containing protein n=2 Tax=unclassified Pseudomonas TaxID=196821 RepID=UPI0008E28104
PLEQPLRFQGQYFDPESGLHYNRHRYYNPATGRYLTPDPSKLAGGVNAYRYTLNPTGWVDPLGLNTCPGGDGCRPKGGVEDPAGKARVDSEDPTYPSRKIDEKHLYRGDSREPWEIFDSGFEPLGESRDLYLHAHDNRNPPSFFVSTTKMPSESVKFATGYGLDLGYIYVMRKVPGIYVNKKLGLLSPHRREIEVAVPGGVSPKDILGATPINADGSHVGYSVLNPNKR